MNRAVGDYIAVERADLFILLSVNGVKDEHLKAMRDGGEFTPSNITISDLGILNRAADLPPDYPASINDIYLLSKQKNNSYTDTNGITYTWTEGTGW